MSFERVYSGAAWESRYGYCRALRAGPVVYLTGTAPIAPDGGVHKPGDAAAQTLRCYEIMETALRRFELDRRSIVRCRMYVTDIARADEFGRAHAAFFDGHHPCLTMVEVKALIDPHMLIEIEAEAYAETTP